MNNNYFTRDIQDNINSMSNDQMKALLLELENTAMWIAILKYNQERMIIVQNSLMTLDPIAKTTEICRNQGILNGMSDLTQAVILLKEKADKNAPEKISQKE